MDLALLAASSPQYLRVGGLEKVWEVDLKKALQAEQLGREQSFKVKSLSFSPDAQQIVVLLEGSAVLFLDILTAGYPMFAASDPDQPVADLWKLSANQDLNSGFRLREIFQLLVKCDESCVVVARQRQKISIGHLFVAENLLEISPRVDGRRK
jgi:hypothetical protein